MGIESTNPLNTATVFKKMADLDKQTIDFKNTSNQLVKDATNFIKKLEIQNTQNKPGSIEYQETEQLIKKFTALIQQENARREEALSYAKACKSGILAMMFFHVTNCLSFGSTEDNPHTLTK